MLEWSLDALAESALVGQVVVAVPPGFDGAVDIAGDGVEVVFGGTTRTESVTNALALCQEELVVVHDAARPLATPALFDQVIERVASDDSLAGAIAASGINDTVKQVTDDGLIAGTIDRSTLRAAETPQVFRTVALREAIESAAASEATDEAMLVEATGGSVATVDSAEENFKVTTPADLQRAATLLQARR